MEAGVAVTALYFTDPLCIWAFLADDKLDRLAQDFGGALVLEHRMIPVFGSVPWRLTRGPWAKEGIPGRCEATRRVAAEHGHPEVSGEVWRSATPSSSWSAAAAVKAVFSAAQSGECDADAGARYLRAMRRRFFVDEQNVCARSVQLALAEEQRVAPASVERRLDDGSALALVWEDAALKDELKLTGSPTWVFDGGRAQLYGNVAYGVLRATLEELARGAVPGCSSCG